MTRKEVIRLVNCNRRSEIPIELLRKIVLYTTRRNGENFFLHEMSIDSLESGDDLQDWINRVFKDEFGYDTHWVNQDWGVAKVEYFIELFIHDIVN